MTAKITFSMTTTATRAPHIAPTIGSLLAYPNSRVNIVAPAHIHRMVPSISDRVSFESTPHDYPTNKWCSYISDSEFVSSADDDFIYAIDDIKMMVEYLESAKSRCAYQARGIYSVFNAEFKPKAMNCKGRVMRTQQLFGGYLVGMPLDCWREVRREYNFLLRHLTHEDKLADDYTTTKIMTSLRIPIYALPINFGEPGHTYACPYNSDPDALHKREGGNNARYIMLAKRDSENGNAWWKEIENV